MGPERKWATCHICALGASGEEKPAVVTGESQPGGSSPGWGQQPQTPPPSGGDPLSALAGGLDPQLLLRFLPLIQELGGARDSNARQLLYALRPYLKPERQEKVERALQLARLFHLGRKFLAGWEG